MMGLIDAALGRSRTVLMTLALVLIAGTVAYIEIPKESDPDVAIPIIYVAMTHEGISPEDAERLLVRPMEEELRAIEGIKEMRATAFEGGANVVLEFDAGFDPDKAMEDVRAKVDIAKPDLPDDTDEPTVNEVNVGLFPILLVTLAGDVPERVLLRLARDLQERLEGLPNVLSADIGGDRDELVEIVIEPLLVESYNLSIREITDAMRRGNRLVAAGNMDTGKGRFSLKVPGLFEEVSDIIDMPVSVKGDAVVRLRDIATARRTFKDRRSFARVNGRPALAIEISKRTGTNIIETVNQVRAIVETERRDWPAGVEVAYSQDKSADIQTLVNDLQNNVISAFLLIMIVVVAVLGPRSGLLVGIAIPGSFLTGILVLGALGLTINMVVLFSLILAVGMLVDGTIVVTEYADRKRHEG
ncbi:MAG: efflux RND transporter permease subunit, partial [Alphaproteobacteria bacterium]